MKESQVHNASYIFSYIMQLETGHFFFDLGI